MAAIMAANVDDLFDDYSEVWSWIKTYNSKYKSLPSVEVVADTFKDFEQIYVDGATGHYLEQLTAEHMQSSIEEVVNKAKTLIKVMSPNELLGHMQSDLAKLNRFSAISRDVNIMDPDEAVARYAALREAAAANGGVPGIPTGIVSIDSAYPSGLAGGDLIVFLGWTGRGKSLLSELICCRAYERGHKPMIFSMEMSPGKVQDRCLTILGSGLFKNSDLMLGDLDVDAFRTWSKNQAGPAFIVPDIMGGDQITPNFVGSKIEQHRPGIVVIDYAQLATDNERSADMVSRMRNMSMQYKALAEAHHIPIILISSATPENGVTSIKTPPIIEQVAWSRQLSYDADLAIAVHRHDNSNIIELVCRKNRNGDLFSAYLEWWINEGIITEKFDI